MTIPLIVSSGERVMPESFRQYRWRQFATLALMYILVYFYRVSLAVVSVDVSQELHLTPEQLGLLAGILFFVYAVAQLPLGPLIDRVGPTQVMSVCGLLTALGGVLFATADTLLAAMAGRILIGTGTASVLMATFTIFSHWYTKQEFSRASGLMVAAGNLGNLAGTAPLAFVVGFWGWRSSFMAVSCGQALITLLVWAKVKNTPPNVPQCHELSHGDRPSMLEAWKILFYDRDFWLLAFVAFSWYGNYMAVQGLWGGPYLMEVLRLSREAVGGTLMWTSIGFIVGSIGVDTVARRLFHSYTRTLWTGQLALLGLMSGFMGWLSRIPVEALPLYFFLVGLAVSSGIMIYPIIRARIPVDIVGTGLSTLNFFVLLGAAVAQQGMGSLLMVGGGYTNAGFRMAFAAPVMSLAVALLVFPFTKNCPAE